MTMSHTGQLKFAVRQSGPICRIDVVVVEKPPRPSPSLKQVTFPLFTCAAIGAAKAAAVDTYHAIQRGETSTHEYQGTLKRMGEDAAYWGTVGGAYAATEYGLERMRGKRDWKNNFIAGAVSGAVSCAMRKSDEETLMEYVVNGSIICAVHLAQSYIRGK